MIAAQVVVHVTNSEDSTALVFAVVGIVLGAVSLVWQIASRQLERPRLKLTLKQAWADPAHTSIVTAPISDDMNAPTAPPAQGFTIPYLAVEVQNVGRFPTGI